MRANPTSVLEASVRSNDAHVAEGNAWLGVQTLLKADRTRSSQGPTSPRFLLTVPVAPSSTRKNTTNDMTPTLSGAIVLTNS